MFIEGQGNLLKAEVDALVNTVNTVGVMGRGVALQFKQAFPHNFRAYQAACRRGEVMLGHMFVTRTGQLRPEFIINFPTKKHWREQSRLETIRTGLVDLIAVVRRESIRSIALPPLGCGLGGLRWEDVHPLIVQAFSELPQVEVHLYPPGHDVSAEERVIRTPRPEMTLWRAALICLIGAYSRLAFEASHLEAQKLLYFLVEAGEPLPTKFAKGDYGPYDDGMKHGLLEMEGHYIQGFGEGKRLDPVSLAPGALEAARSYLRASPDTVARIERVTRLIEGFETPYGLELLASVHWAATREARAANRSLEQVVELVHAWTERKRRTLRARDLQVAWEQLQAQGWLPLPEPEWPH
ncbi:MAG TPA: macro domain-containing protein [Chthonomonadaceae bacterium]|nr:macro domain-containing protein [Chthonomonadaceae bacterium]